MASVITPKFRVSYPNVFKPKLNDLNGKEEYSLVALFPKDADLKKLKEEVQRVIVAKWGPEKAKWPTNLRSPFRDQSERAKNSNGKLVLPGGYEEGAIFINLKSSERPGVVDGKVQPIIDPTDYYAGCWSIASVNAYAYDTKGNRGVSFGLVNLQKVGDGDPLGNRAKAEHDFSPIETEAGTVTGTSTDIFS